MEHGLTAVLPEAAFNGARDAIAIIGRDYRYLRVNRATNIGGGSRTARTAEMHISDVVGMEAFQKFSKPNLTAASRRKKLPAQREVVSHPH